MITVHSSIEVPEDPNPEDFKNLNREVLEQIKAQDIKWNTIVLAGYDLGKPKGFETTHPEEEDGLWLREDRDEIDLEDFPSSEEGGLWTYHFSGHLAMSLETGVTDDIHGQHVDEQDRNPLAYLERAFEPAIGVYSKRLLLQVADVEVLHLDTSKSKNWCEYKLKANGRSLEEQNDIVDKLKLMEIQFPDRQPLNERDTGWGARTFQDEEFGSSYSDDSWLNKPKLVSSLLARPSLPAPGKIG